MRMIWKSGVAVLVAGGLIWGILRHQAAARADWQKIAPGIEMCVLRKGRAKIVALRVAPNRVRMACGATLDAAQWRNKMRAVAVINGGYFDEAGKSLGLRVANGRRISRLRASNWGVFWVRGGQAKIEHTRDFDPASSGIREAIQCGPRLVVAGKTTDLKPQSARRTGIGIARDGRVVLAICDRDLSFQDWANVWASRRDLDCRDALNLDGGGSTQFSLRAGKKRVEIGGAWPVPDAVAIK